MTRVALLLALGLTGCVAAEGPKSASCGAAGMQDLVGESRDVLAAMTLPAGSRVIEPGMPVTKEYRADRLNIELDDTGLIARVRCG